jgi:hypothetical protein
MTAGGEMKDVIEAMVEAYKNTIKVSTDSQKDWDEGPMRAALSAALERGYRLVPVEPTIEMLADGNEPMAALELQHGIFISDGVPVDVYRAMIAASPEVK